MSTLPALTTDRLILRPFTLSDGPRVQELAGKREIAATTLLIPHPYEDGLAEQWISTHKEDYQKHGALHFAVCLKSGILIGAIGFMPNKEHQVGEIGYWIGTDYWGQGYCTEASRAVLKYVFDELNLRKVYATHFSHNPASGRVMEKLGMQKEGVLRQHITKWGQSYDLVYYGILREEFYAQNQ
ncbi:MAG: GNAT family N-acetyltransferase [Limnochordia bacterium]|jgi:ribosomal-protein-alanine N-acetyltransferase